MKLITKALELQGLLQSVGKLFCSPNCSTVELGRLMCHCSTSDPVIVGRIPSFSGMGPVQKPRIISQRNEGVPCGQNPML